MTITNPTANAVPKPARVVDLAAKQIVEHHLNKLAVPQDLSLNRHEFEQKKRKLSSCYAPIMRH